MSKRKPKRSWFRIHLSTAWVMILVAAVLVLANMRVRYGFTSGGPLLVGTDYGWPYVCFNSYWGFELYLGAQHWAFRELPMALNILIAIAILAATAFACEWFLYSRERNKQEPQP